MDFLHLLCNLYIIGLMAVLPLYTEGTYYQLGDSKYLFFRNLSVICLGLWIAASFAEQAWKKRRRWSVTDICMLLYGLAVIVSACASKYGTTAWTGYREWYMGAVSQLIFVGIYFFVSRCYDGKKYPLNLSMAAFFVVTFLGIMHRLGLDPTGLTEEFLPASWEYSHMLSTVGNINWFCGYCGIALALPTVCYLKAKNRGLQVILYGVSAFGLLLLFIQGSDIGVVISALCLLICMVYGIRDEAMFERSFLLAGGFCFLVPVYGLIASCIGENALAALPEDSIGWGVICSPGWWAVGVVCVILCFLHRYLIKTGKMFSLLHLRRSITGGFLLLFLIGAVTYLLKHPFGSVWGSGRGTLWSVAWKGFLQNGWLQKLVGVGPDCFAEYIYSAFSGDNLLILEGRWSNALYANAHNEWLNHLVNLGIMGTGCYLGIFMTCAWRYRKNLLGILVIFLYGVTSLTCFQQCMSTPLLFMMLGICEAGLRAQEQKLIQKGGHIYEMGKIQN